MDNDININKELIAEGYAMYCEETAAAKVSVAVAAWGVDHLVCQSQRVAYMTIKHLACCD